MSIPISQFIPHPPFLPGNHKTVFCNCFCFINGTNELIYETETVTDNSLMVTRVERRVRDKLRDWD